MTRKTRQPPAPSAKDARAPKAQPGSQPATKATTSRQSHRPRTRDNNLKRRPAKAAAEVFVDTLIRIPNSKGAIARAARAAYPRQSARSSRVTGSRLLANPTVQQMLHDRRRQAEQHADITRQQLRGLLTQMASVSMGDFTNAEGELDWNLAREKGIDHLVSQVEVTERHSEVGNISRKRITTKFKLPDKIKALDLIADIDGLKKQAAKNPIDSARESYEIMRRRPEYADLPDDELAKLAQESHGLPQSAVMDILSGAVKRG